MLLEKTQRRLCRLLFVVGCLLPTLAIAGWTARRLSPGYDDALLAAVGERLGVGIGCERLRTPRPGVYELTGLTLHSVATGETLLECDALRLASDGAGWRFAASETRVVQPTACGEWLVALLDSDLAAEGVVGSVEADAAGLAVDEVSVSLDGANGQAELRGRDQTIRLGLSRETIGATRVAVDAVKTPAPLAWLPCPSLAACGLNDGDFFGHCDAVLVGSEDPSGEATGRLRIASYRSAGVTADHGEIELTSLRWQGTRIDELVGRIDLRDGSITRTLVEGLNEWVGMGAFKALQTAYSEAADQASFGFTQLACEVELDPKGLTVIAGCGEIDGRLRGGAVAHAVAEKDGEPLLREPAERELPAWRLVRAIWPHASAELPATSQAAAFLSRLPAPSSMSR